jgi:hypothetical protein
MTTFIKPFAIAAVSIAVLTPPLPGPFERQALD